MRGEWERCDQRRPSWIRHGIRIAVHVCQLDGGDGAPGVIGVFGIPRSDDRICQRDIEQCQQMRVLREREVPLGGKPGCHRVPEIGRIGRIPELDL